MQTPGGDLPGLLGGQVPQDTAEPRNVIGSQVPLYRLYYLSWRELTAMVGCSTYHVHRDSVPFDSCRRSGRCQDSSFSLPPKEGPEWRKLSLLFSAGCICNHTAEARFWLTVNRSSADMDLALATRTFVPYYLSVMSIDDFGCADR